MAKQSVVLELEVEAGYEPTGEYRSPVPGDWCLMHDGRAWRCDCRGIGSQLILRKTWQPPKWLPDGCWVYKYDDVWRVSKTNPVRAEGVASDFNPTLGSLYVLFDDVFETAPSKTCDAVQVKHG
jgi:hypothetical protein